MICKYCKNKTKPGYKFCTSHKDSKYNPDKKNLCFIANCPKDCTKEQSVCKHHKDKYYRLYNSVCENFDAWVAKQ